jgi:hypothetical protein
MYQYSKEELKVMYPSCDPECLLGEKPAYKDKRVNGDAYETLVGAGTIKSGELYYGTCHIGKYDMTILGKRMRVVFNYSGTTKYKQWVNDPLISLEDILRHKVDMPLDEFEKLLEETSTDSYYERKFKEKARELVV